MSLHHCVLNNFYLHEYSFLLSNNGIVFKISFTRVSGNKVKNDIQVQWSKCYLTESVRNIQTTKLGIVRKELEICLLQIWTHLWTCLLNSPLMRQQLQSFLFFMLLPLFLKITITVNCRNLISIPHIFENPHHTWLRHELTCNLPAITPHYSFLPFSVPENDEDEFRDACESEKELQTLVAAEDEQQAQRRSQVLELQAKLRSISSRRAKLRTREVMWMFIIITCNGYNFI